MGIEKVVKNSKGNWFLDFLQRFMYATNNLMELLVLRQGVKLVMKHNMCPTEINIDS